MGLLDSVLSSLGGQNTQGNSGSSGSGLSSMLLPALMALLAAKSGGAGGLGGMLGNASGYGGGNQQSSGPAGGIGSVLGGFLGGTTNGQGAGGLGGSLGSILGGAGVAGALGQLVQSFERNGQGHVVNSWVGTGVNQPLEPQDVSQGLGPDVIDALSQHTGMSESDIASQLSTILPQAVDKLTPQGRLPTSDEAAQW